jgi:hypothetical protein
MQDCMLSAMPGSAADRAEHATMPLVVWCGPGRRRPADRARLIVV